MPPSAPIARAQRRPGSSLLLGSALVFATGLTLQLLVLVAGGWPSFAPLLLSAYSVPFIAWASWARRSSSRDRAPWLARRASVLGLPLLIGGLLLNLALTGLTTRVTERMTWTLVEDSDTARGEVRLWFRDAPDHFVAFESAELLRYLEGAGGRDVDVQFELTSDYGRVRGFRLVRVGAFDRLVRTRSYSGCVDSCQGSPW